MEALAQIFAATEAGMLTLAAVFTRIGAAVFLVPGLGERGLPMRLRLGAAVALTLLLTPLVQPLVPQTPQDLPGLVTLLTAEAVSGLAIGIGFRILVFVLQIAGTTAAMHMSISHMFGTGVAQEPEPTIATLLTLGGIVLAMKAGLHIALVAALARLYDVLPFGQFPIGDEMGAWSVGRISAAFAIGMSLAFPFIVISFIYNVALGAMSRAMPQLLVSLVGAPLLVGLGMLTLYLVLPELYASWRPVMQAVLAFPLVDLR